ncbi:hypothetical protein RJ641_027892 [Dillenia turbinata]|uniref:START domain-containing protein n=1 Tax=Dillenia turbinata TaxID=194707 RepID=A0AAN8VY40_9MAGN
MTYGKILDNVCTSFRGLHAYYLLFRMDGKQKIIQYRERLDKSLASPHLTERQSLKEIVKNQLCRSSQVEIDGDMDNLVERRTTDVSAFLDMLRSASGVARNHEKMHADWKLKQDNEEFRVMYREGPVGSPFHTLLVEGYIDGPIDVYASHGNQLCTKNGGPSLPFQPSRLSPLSVCKIPESVPWPLSAREALVHYFEIEYFKDDLIVVLLNSISDLENVDRRTHGFTKDGIPEAKDMVRIDVVGGFALQKVTPDRSYFRTIANMDIKMEFIPPTLINFISRQLIGNGFRLYQKIIASVSKGNDDFSPALGDPLYSRIREALYSNSKPNGALEAEDLKRHLHNHPEERSNPEESLIKEMEDDLGERDQTILAIDTATKTLQESTTIVGQGAFGEIVEEEIIESKSVEEDIKDKNEPSTNRNILFVNDKKVTISLEVEEALSTLERAISIVRGVRPHVQIRPTSLGSEDSLNLDNGMIKQSSKAVGIHFDDHVKVKESREETMIISAGHIGVSSGIHGSRHAGSNSRSRDMSNKKITPALPEKNESPYDDSHSSSSDSTRVLNLDNPMVGSNSKAFEVQANGFSIHENGPSEEKNLMQQLHQKRKKYRCWHFFPFHKMR